MSNVPGQYTPLAINHIFANLQPHDVEQFYAVYQQWLRQRTIANLQAQIASLRNQIAENNLRIQQVQPSPLALSALARLQSNGVTDLDLLDHMLDQGEAWLDSAMQHLDYCEQLDFIRGNYTEWCEHALEGAYDWIDSMQELDASNAAGDADAANNDKISTASSADPQTGEQLNEATEEIFLQKLMSEGDVSLLDTPQEIAIVSSTAQVEALVAPIPLEEQNTAHMQASDSHATQSIEHPIETHTSQEVPASTSIDATGLTPVPVDEPSSMGLDDETLSSMTADPADSPPDIDNISGSTVIPAEPVPDIEQPEAGPAERALANTVDTAETSATPHLPLEQSGTTEPKKVEHEAVAAETASDEVVVSPDTHELEEATTPLIPVVTPPEAISDASTTPIIPAAEASPSKNAEPAARSRRKRNLLQRLFSIFFRRKPN